MDSPVDSDSLVQVPLRHADGSPIVWPATLRALSAITEAVFARNGQPPPRERMEWMGRETEDFLARCGGQSRFFFSLMVWLVSLAAPLLSGRFALLGSLHLEDRVLALENLERRFAEPLLAVKAILCLIYYEHPEAGREVGFDGECHVPGSTRLPVHPG